jgi:hypothetical protein
MSNEQLANCYIVISANAEIYNRGHGLRAVELDSRLRGNDGY